MVDMPDEPTRASRATVVIPVYESVPLLYQLFEEIERQAAASGMRVAVIAVDDASPRPIDPRIDRSRFPNLDLQILRREKNGGPGAARNVGLPRVRTDWVVFLDADTVPAPDWLTTLETVIDGIPDGVAGAEGKVVVPGQSTTPFAHATEIDASAGQHGGANIVYRTRVLLDVGGFDERFFDVKRKMHFREDNELRFRMADNGHTVAHAPELVLIHPPLEASFWTPAKLARRYYFDPLIEREHPQRFKDMNALRRVGPYPLRRARHDAAFLFMVSIVLVIITAIIQVTPLLILAILLLLVAWLANIGSLCYKRSVEPKHIVPVAAAALITPLVYAYYWTIGWWKFKIRKQLPRQNALG